MMKINSNDVFLAGEFAVLAQLALRGYVANMTLGRTKGIDILVANPDTGRMRKIEVKTSTHPRLRWVMQEKHERSNDPDLFFCFVAITKDYGFRFVVVPSADVANYLTRAHKQWADEKPSRKRATPMRIFLFTYAGEKYAVATPTIEKYENNWQIMDV